MIERETIIRVLKEIANDKRMLNHADYWALICAEAAELLEEQEQSSEPLRGGYVENLITTAIALKLKDVPLPTGVALEMVRRLKAHEPVKPILDSRAIEFYRCGQCNEPIDRCDNYCWSCGREIKWE